MKKKLEGQVVSDKMDKTITVLVKRIVAHLIYNKKYTISKKYKAHDEKNEYKINDKVVIQESKPFSKDKKWQVISKIKRNEK